jgi:methyl-accepting chemotaxis protein
MALGFSWKKLNKAVAPDAVPKIQTTSSLAETASASDDNSAKEILALLELELGAMIRQLERASASVAGRAQSTAAKLSTIRQRTEAPHWPNKRCT